MERECGIRKRWTWSMDSAKEIVVEIMLEERRRLIETLRSLAHERLFLLKMKRLYASKTVTSHLPIDNGFICMTPFHAT